MRLAVSVQSVVAILSFMLLCFVPDLVSAQGYDYFYGFSGMPDAVSSLRPSGEGIKVGPFRFTPGVSINGTYTDNARFSQGNEDSDFIMSISPTFTFALGQGLKLKDYIAFGYDGDLGAYLKVSDNSYTSHTLWAEVNLLQHRATYLKLRQEITYTDDPYGDFEYVGLGTSTSRITNTTDVTLGRNLPGGYSVELGYENYLENFLKSVDEDRNNMTNTGTLSLLYELTGKTKLLGEYSFSYRDFYNMPSSTSASYTVNQFMTGFRWAATARLSGELKGGYGWRTFVNDADEFGNPYKDSGTFIYDANLNYMLTHKTTVGLEAGREFLLGADTAFGTDILDLTQDAYVRNFVGLRVTTKARPNLTFNAAGEFNIEPYEDTPQFQDRTDYYYNLRLGFDHTLRKYFSYGLYYTFNKRDSQAEGDSYTANAVTATVRFTY